SIGHKSGSFDPVELDALWKLAGLSSDGVRIRFIREGLASSGKTRRLGLRAEWVVHAVAGLSSERKRQIEQVLNDRMHEPGASANVRLACSLLGATLPVEDPAFIQKMALTLADGMGE